jgi:hypothetical protein
VELLQQVKVMLVEMVLQVRKIARQAVAVLVPLGKTQVL